jgi:Leucine-rich repeat (LRR) protein
LAELQTLNLSNNRLTGTIPAALSSMINLSTVNLAGNDELRDSSTMSSPGSAKSASPLLTPSFVNRNITSHHSAEWNILMDLFQDSNGKQWSIRTNWGSDRPLSDWHGITLNSKGYVKKIVIHNNNIDGCIPDSIRGLQYLQVLDLRFNCINGCIPESICELSSLTHIHLHGNRLQGEMPQSIGYLSMLKVLDVRSNALCGDIPQSLSLLNNLWYLGISSNNFTLTVSLKEKKEICRLTNTKEASVKSYAKFLLPTLHSIE